MSDIRRSAPALEVRGLDVYYGHSHALQGVDLTLDSGVFSVVGRNGMGKTTLCKTIMGLLRASGGSVRVRGEDITRLSPARIAQAGVGYVPQGRRLWRSLSVAEHLSLAAGMRRGAWTIDRIYETFPRLAERKDHGGGQLSGGEQQMLAISRALLTNPQLLIMDEPTEGLAPVIVAQVEEMLVRLGEDGDMSVLVIEQNIGVATAISKNVAIMVNGRVNRIINSARLAADRELQQRLLGVGVVGVHAEPETDIEAADASAGAEARPAPPRAAEYGASPDLHLQSHAADALVAAGAHCAHRGRRAHAFDGRYADRRRCPAKAPGRRGRTKRIGATRRPRRRHARYQGRGTALHSRRDRRTGLADAAGRRVDQRQALHLRRLRPGNRARTTAAADRACSAPTAARR